MVGRIRCVAAERSAPGSSDSQASIEVEAGHRLEVILHRDAPGHRRPAQLHREQQDQQQAPPEDRHRVTGERAHHHAVVEHRIAAYRGEHAGRDADHQREHDRAQRELDGGREQGQELVQHGRLRDHRLAQVAVQQAADVDAVLHQHRLVQPVLVHQRCVACRVDAALAGQCLDRVARHQPDQEEREQRHADEGRDDEAEAGQDESEHGQALRPHVECGRKGGSISQLPAGTAAPWLAALAKEILGSGNPVRASRAYQLSSHPWS